MKFFNKTLSFLCLLLLCMTQAGCGLIELPFDLIGSAVSTAVSAGLAYGPTVAPFFM